MADFDQHDDHQSETSALQIVTEGLAHLDPVDWVDRRVGVWLHRPWRRILERYGLSGLLRELARTAAGDGSWRFHIPRQEGLSGWEIERMLAQYGVAIWGRGFDAETIYFSVKREQVDWAEYLLKRRGVAVMTTPYNPLNDLYPQRHPPGSMPTPWREKKKGGEK